MSGENERRATVAAVQPDRTLAILADEEPRTTTEVAEAVEASTASVAAALEDLRERGALASKTVGPSDVRIWYPPATVDAEQAATEEPADVDTLVAEMDVPGTSEMMRSWRRDAIRETVEHVRERRRTTAAEIRSDMFDAHPAGYDDAYVWWEMVRPRLASVPGVERPADGEDAWQYVSPP